MGVAKKTPGQADRVTNREHSGLNGILLPTIALSAHWDTFPHRFQWAVEHGFAATYTPNPSALHELAPHVKLLLDAGVPVRYHGFLPQHDFGHRDPATAERGLQLHKKVLDAIRNFGEQVITFHVGLNPKTPIDHCGVVRNLSRLVERGRQLGITVCLENLRYGPTSHPEIMLAWAESSGALITLDIGHAVSCRRVQSGEMTAIDFIEAFDGRIEEAHIYEREADRHYPPKDMAVLGPILDRLLETTCSWWTIELDDLGEALSTRSLLLEHLQTHGGGEQAM